MSYFQDLAHSLGNGRNFYSYVKNVRKIQNMLWICEGTSKIYMNLIVNINVISVRNISKHNQENTDILNSIISKNRRNVNKMNKIF